MSRKIGDGMTAKQRYDKAHKVNFALRLTDTTDADIIRQLRSQDSIQGYIKRLIREDIAKQASVSDLSKPEYTDRATRPCPGCAQIVWSRT